MSAAEQESVTVATSGHIVGRHDKCATCGAPMLFLVPEIRVISTFCPNLEGCKAALRQIPE